MRATSFVNIAKRQAGLGPVSSSYMYISSVSTESSAILQKSSCEASLGAFYSNEDVYCFLDICLLDICLFVNRR